MNRFLVLSFLALTACVSSGSNPPVHGAAQFDRMKAMQGVWTSTPVGAGMGQKSDAEYRLTSGGSVLVETLMRGTPEEMVTMYHLDGGLLILTHYCSVGNQPTMVAEPNADTSRLNFACVGGTNFVCGRDKHMHAAQFAFVDRDHVRTVWLMKDGDEIVEQAQFDMVRRSN